MVSSTPGIDTSMGGSVAVKGIVQASSGILFSNEEGGE